MVNKHFFKTLIVFTGMIVLGLLGVFLVSYVDSSVGENAEAVPIAK